MEKLVYVVWKPETMAADDFRDDLLGSLASKLAALGAMKLAVSAVDSAASRARRSVITHLPEPIAAVVSFWLHTHLERGPLEAAIAHATARRAGYLVLESVPIVNTTEVVPLGSRTPGLNTIGFLEKPARLETAEWLELWQGQHTRVAVETQSTFLYIQNAVVRALTAYAPPWVAIVEEGFPAAAFSDPKVFYAAGDSEAVLERNRGRMIESCLRFIDLGHLESHVFSHYVLTGERGRV